MNDHHHVFKERPSIKHILNYWSSKEALFRVKHLECKYGIELDFRDGVEHNKDHAFCFACYRHYSSWNKLDRAHIIPQMLGGLNKPSNFVMLCKECHLDNPNTKNEDSYFNWLGNVQGYEYKKIQQIRKAMKVFNITEDVLSSIENLDMEKLIQDSMDEAGIHQGINFNSICSIMEQKLKVMHSKTYIQPTLPKHKKRIEKTAPKEIGEQLDLFG